MGITYFALGMLSMLALIFVGVIVWGLIKVLRIERQIVAIKENDKFEFDTVHRQFENVYRTIGEHRDNSSRDFSEFHRIIHDELDKVKQHEIRRFDELLLIINNRFDDSIRYTDKRVDKSCTKQPSIPTPTLS